MKNTRNIPLEQFSKQLFRLALMCSYHNYKSDQFVVFARMSFANSNVFLAVSRRFIGTCLDGGVVNIFMEYVPGGSIASILAR